MPKETAIMHTDRTPHASPASCSEADRAGSCRFLGKQPLTYQELWLRLLKKGMDAGSYTEKTATACFKQYGFYRLRGYWAALEEDGSFKPGVSFDDVINIARFDEDISRFILGAILNIELALREAFSYCLAQRYGAYALDDAAVFKDKTFFELFQRSHERELAQGLRYKLSYVAHYERRGESMPIWACVGLMSLGTLSKAYRNLADAGLSREIAGRFNLKIPTMANWLRYLTQLRNMCAHQDRLYNVMFAVRPALFREHKSLDTMRLFPAFIVIFHMLESVDAESAASMRARFERIMGGYEGVDLKPVGFPGNWRDLLPNCKLAEEGKSASAQRRHSNAGRHRKDQSAIDEALSLYDANSGTIAQIAEQTGVGHSTLYKYINLRKQETCRQFDYAMVPLRVE